MLVSDIVINMSTYSDIGIILGNFNLAEKDKIINIYTRGKGLVRAVAKGTKKPNTKFSGKLERLSCCKFQFAIGKNLDTICDIEQINSFPKLRNNLSVLTFGILFIEIVKNFAQEEEFESELTYDLLYSSLDNLQASKDPELLCIKFIMEFLSIHGFNPQFDNCVSCSAEVIEINNKYSYSSILGGLLCKNCLNIDHKIIEPSVFKILHDFSDKVTDYGVFQEPGDSYQKSEDKSQTYNKNDIRLAIELLQEHLNNRAQSKINSFDMVLSL